MEVHGGAFVSHQKSFQRFYTCACAQFEQWDTSLIQDTHVTAICCISMDERLYGKQEKRGVHTHENTHNCACETYFSRVRERGKWILVGVAILFTKTCLQSK